MTSYLRAAVFTSLVIAAAVGCKKGGNSANSPVSPGNTTLLGVWTGTITRPGGLPSLSVRWETPDLNAYTLSGPVTLTNGSGATVTIAGQGNTAGNDSNGYKIHMSFQSSAVFPNCTIRGNTAGSGEGDPFPSPYRSITVPAFEITYLSCQSFTGVNNPNLAETVQLNLTKQ